MPVENEAAADETEVLADTEALSAAAPPNEFWEEPGSPAITETPETVEFLAAHKRLLLAIAAVTVLAIAAWLVSTILVVQAQIAAREGTLGTSAEVADEGDTGALPSVATSGSGAAVAGPADVVRALYEAMATGDRDSARSAFAYPDDFDADLMAGWGTPVYRIVSVAAGIEHGEQWVQVDEPDGGIPDADVVTWALVEVDGRWGIVGWMSGTIADQQGGSSPAETPELEAGQLTVANAKAVVNAFMEARLAGDRNEARRLATAYLLEEQPELLSKNAPVPDEFAIDDTYAEGAAIVVRVRETRNREITTFEYLVVNDNGTPRVDERR